MSLNRNVVEWLVNAKDLSNDKVTQEKNYKACLKALKVTERDLVFTYFKEVRNKFVKGYYDKKPDQKVRVQKVKTQKVKTQKVFTKPTGSRNLKRKNKQLPEVKIKISEWIPSSEKLNPLMFQTWKSGLGIDEILSNDGGATKCSTIVVMGGPGVGKTTLCAGLQKEYQERYPKAKIACIQGEMKRFDINYEIHGNQVPWMNDIRYILVKDYGYENVMNTLKTVFKSGYDILFIDSVESICKILKSYCNMTKTEAETELVRMFNDANDGKNNFNEKGEKVFSTIFAIQQVTKGGDFVGGNGLKHDTTGMLELDFDDHFRRRASFSKNRRCGKHQNKFLYYKLDKENENRVKFDLELFKETDSQRELLSNEKDRIKDLASNFDAIFAKKKFEEKEELVVADSDYDEADEVDEEDN